MIDDAHALERDALAYLQLTSGMEMPTVSCFQIVFAGSPQFWSLLETDRLLRPMRDRIAFRAVLETPLDQPEIAAPPSAEPPPRGSALATVPRQETSRSLIVLPPVRRRGIRYTLGAGIAATLVLASAGPVARDPVPPTPLAAATPLTPSPVAPSPAAPSLAAPSLAAEQKPAAIMLAATTVPAVAATALAPASSANGAGTAIAAASPAPSAPAVESAPVIVAPETRNATSADGLGGAAPQAAQAPPQPWDSAAPDATASIPEAAGTGTSRGSRRRRF